MYILYYIDLCGRDAPYIRAFAAIRKLRHETQLGEPDRVAQCLSGQIWGKFGMVEMEISNLLFLRHLQTWVVWRPGWIMLLALI